MNYLVDFFIFNITESADVKDLKFVKQPKKKDAKTDIYNVIKSDTIIGQIKWNSRLRGYAFVPTKDCDETVKAFIKELMLKRKSI